MSEDHDIQTIVHPDDRYIVFKLYLGEDERSFMTRVQEKIAMGADHVYFDIDKSGGSKSFEHVVLGGLGFHSALYSSTSPTQEEAFDSASTGLLITGNVSLLDRVFYGERAAEDAPGNKKHRRYEFIGRLVDVPEYQARIFPRLVKTLPGYVDDQEGLNRLQEENRKLREEVSALNVIVSQARNAIVMSLTN